MQRRGKWFRLVVLHVTGRDAQGRARTANLVYGEESIPLTDGDEFVTAYLPEAAINRKPS